MKHYYNTYGRKVPGKYKKVVLWIIRNTVNRTTSSKVTSKFSNSKIFTKASCINSNISAIFIFSKD